MDAWESIWPRYGPRKHVEDVEYSLLDHPGRTSRDHDQEIRGEVEVQSLHSSPAISWQTEPTFTITINFNILRRLALPFALSLLPRFIYTDESRKPKKLSKTSYLDGLRGVAALFVVFHHYSLVFTPSSPQGWHSDAEGQNKWFFQLPLIRVVHSGRFMVAIFFVVSGYVLSYRGLRLAREGKPIELLDSLASSVFRRWLRLHIPVILSTFVGFLMTRMVLWTNLPAGWYPAIPVDFAGQPLPEPAGTFTQQFWDWYADTQQLCDPFRFGATYTSKYSINILWTIPIEFINSMVVFIVVLGIARLRTWVKFATLTLLIYWCHYTARWEPGTFLAGTFLAELSLVQTSRSTSSSTSSPTPSPLLEKPLVSHSSPVSRYNRLISPTFWTLLFVLSLTLGSQPQSLSSTSPLFITPMRHIPQSYSSNPNIFYPSLSAPLVLLSLSHLPNLQRLFTTRFALYLGEISFSLYLLHALVLFSLGQSFIPKCLAATGGWRNGQWGFVGAMLLGTLVVGPVTVWVADVWARGVDERAVRFARWVGERCKAKGE